MSFEEPIAKSPCAAASGPVRQASAELRTDPLTGLEIIVAPERSLRPHPEERLSQSAMPPERLATCPLCPGNEDRTPTPTLTLPGAPQPWAVRVVPNLYPVVSTSAAMDIRGRPSRTRSATGIHEVVVETPSHNQDLPDREPGQLSLLIDAYHQRLSDIESQPTTQYTLIFKNRGLDAGTSLQHPHSQIVALDFVPREVSRRVQIARRHLRTRGGCLVCAVVAEEQLAGVRIVFERDGFVAFAPYASTTAGELLLVPLTHAPSFAGTPSEKRERLGLSLAALLSQMREAFDDPAYNLVLHTAPKRWHDDAALHWYWKLSPRLTRAAGLELATGLSVNPMAPEDAAARLRGTPPPSG